MSEPTFETVRNPYPGLRPFRSDEKQLFFGREQQVDRMVEKLAAHHFLAVVGGSGSGKSSLVNCGLRPALHRGNMANAGAAWRMAQMRPGSDPVGALARALAAPGVLFDKPMTGALSSEALVESTLRLGSLGLIDMVEQADLPSGTQVLMVADQFEELFRFRSLERGANRDGFGAAEDRVAFVQLLLEAAAQTRVPIYVVLTMRSDFLGDCDQFHGLPEAINEGQYLVPRLTRNEIRAAINGPAAVHAATLSPVLVTRLLNDVGDNPDQLSILQHALNRTWARWKIEGRASGTLDLAHYESIGTMARALDQHAEKAYAELDTARKKLCEKLFKALTDKATDPRGVRRPTTLGILCALADATEAEVTDVINVFRQPSRSFLMPPTPEQLEAGTVIDISHESLMRVWERLNTWANEEAQSARLYCRLAEDAVLHKDGKTSLWSDPGLRLALNWREKEKPTAAWAEQYAAEFTLAMHFLEESKQAREVEQAKQEEEVERQRAFEQARQRIEEQTQANVRLNQQKRKAMWLGICAAGLAVLAVGAAWLANEERGKANEAQKKSFSRELATASVLNLETNPERSLLLALHAANEIMTPEAEGVLHRAILASRGRLILAGHMKLFDAVDVSPDGARLARADYENDKKKAIVKIWNVTSGEEPITLNEYPGKVTKIAFSPDGTRLAIVAYDREKRMASVEIWDATSGETLLMLDGHSGKVTSVAFSPRGTRLAIVAYDRKKRMASVEIWDATSGEHLPTMVGTTTRRKITSIAFSRDKTRLATASQNTIKVWNVATGEELLALEGHTGVVTSVTFSRDSTRLASSSSDQTAKIWDATSGKELRTLVGHTKKVTAVAFSPDVTRLATSSDDNTAKVWDTDSGEELLALVGHTKEVTSVTFSPNGTRLFTGSVNGALRMWELGPERELPSLTHLSVNNSRKESLTSVTFSPDGTRLATRSKIKTDKKWDTTTAKIWDTTSGEELLTLDDVYTGTLNPIAFSPDGTQLAMSSQDETVKVWNAASGQELFTLVGHTEDVNAVAFSPDGTRLATTSRHAAKVWDATTSDELFTLEGHTNLVTDVVFSPDGKRLYTSSNDKTVKVWDTETGRNLLTLHGHTAGIAQFALRRDGTQLATVSGDQTVRRFVLDPDELKALAWKRVTRSPKSLTLDECLLFPHIERCIALGFVRRGQNQAEAGNVHAARASFLEAKTLAPDTISDPEARVKNLAPKGLIKKGERQAKAGGVKGARASFQQAKTLAPDSISDPEAEAEALVKSYAPRGLVRKGERQARAGEVNDAKASFLEALSLDPSLDLDPKAEATKFAVEGLVNKGEIQIRSGDINGARASFQQAKILDPSISDPEAQITKYTVQSIVEKGEWLARQGKVEEAIIAFQEASKLDLDDILISASSWERLCWWGSLKGYAVDVEVKNACEQAVERTRANGGNLGSADLGGTLDSRGVSRVLAGNFPEAIEDFQFYIDYADRSKKRKDLRREWIKQLEKGKNPLDYATLKKLYKQ